MAPLITVITVCRNSERTIARAIQSVASQDWPRVEHLVIDGASTDSTLSIINNYKTKINRLISEPDKGIYDAMNKGLDLSHGEIICFLNSDDQYAHPHVLSGVVKQMVELKLDALMGDVEFFRDGDTLRTVRRYRSSNFHPRRIASGWMPAHPALFLSSEIIQKVGHFRDDYRIAGDFEYIIRIFQNNNLSWKYVPHVMVRMQTGGISNRNWHAKILMNREMLRACRENNVETNILKLLLRYPAKLLEYMIR